MDSTGFVKVLGGIYERSAWVAEEAATGRPFASVRSLHDAMASVVETASGERHLTLVAEHPDLGGRLARSGNLLAASASEQAGLGLDRLSDAEFEQFDRLNSAYRKRFGFPFIIAVKRHTRASVLAAFAVRLGNSKEAELRTALQEIHAIAWFRLDALIDG